MLDADLLDLLNARDIDGYRACIVRFAQSIGFRTVNATTVLDRSGESSEYKYIENIDDPNWALLDPARGKRDPVMQHLKHSSYPINWDAANYRDPAVSENYDLLSSMGLCSGMAIASHLPDGRHFVLSVHADRGLRARGTHLAFALPKMELYSVYALDTAFRLLMPAERRNVGELAPREIEALRYAIDGWSNRMLADRFNLPEASCQEWLGRIAVKLDCRNVSQAALKAWRIGVFR